MDKLTPQQRPDLVLRKYRTCIFVNGCFWHGHLVETNTMESSACCKIPTTNHDFWVAKIRRNKERDKEEQKQLAAMGWHCITVWECKLKPSKREETLDSIAFTLNHIIFKITLFQSLMNLWRRKLVCQWLQRQMYEGLMADV